MQKKEEKRVSESFKVFFVIFSVIISIMLCLRPFFGLKEGTLFGYTIMAVVFWFICALFYARFYEVAKNYEEKIKNQKFFLNLFKGQKETVEAKLRLSDEQLMKKAAKSRLDINMSLIDEEVSFRGNNIVFPAKIIRKRLKEEMRKIERNIENNSEIIEKPGFVIFWEKFVFKPRQKNQKTANI